MLGDVGGEDPVPQLADRWPEFIRSARGGARFGKCPGPAGSDALASPAPVNPTVENEGMAGVRRSAVDTKSNGFGATRYCEGSAVTVWRPFAMDFVPVQL